jgi:hypothetical protein
MSPLSMSPLSMSPLSVSPPLIPAPPPPPPFGALPPEFSVGHDNHYQQHFDPYNVTPNQPPQECLPIHWQSRGSRPPFVRQERTMSSYSPPNNFQSPYIPRLDFNPSVAYGKTQPAAGSFQLKQPVENVRYDPHAFYKYVTS